MNRPGTLYEKAPFTSILSRIIYVLKNQKTAPIFLKAASIKCLMPLARGSKVTESYRM
jgi:hypothetical protein